MVGLQHLLTLRISTSSSGKSLGEETFSHNNCLQNLVSEGNKSLKQEDLHLALMELERGGKDHPTIRRPKEVLKEAPSLVVPSPSASSMIESRPTATNPCSGKHSILCKPPTSATTSGGGLSKLQPECYDPSSVSSSSEVSNTTTNNSFQLNPNTRPTFLWQLTKVSNNQAAFLNSECNHST